MKIIFIAGPYRATTMNEIHRNIENARRVAEMVWSMGHAALCPHLNSAHMDGLVPDEYFLDGGIQMLSRCDSLMLVPRFTESTGTQAELRYAHQRQMPIYIDALPLTDRQWVKRTYPSCMAWLREAA